MFVTCEVIQNFKILLGDLMFVTYEVIQDFKIL